MKFGGGKGIAKLAGGLPVLLLALAAWAVALAGVAVLRKYDGENALGQDLSFTWWVIFFELFVLLAALIHLIGAGVGFLPIGAAAISGILAVVTVLTMLETSRWNTQRKMTSRSDKTGKGAITAFAGFLALSALNLLLILILGNQQDQRRSTETTTHQKGSSLTTNQEYNHQTTGYNTGGMAHATTHAPGTHQPGSVNVV